MHRLEPILGHFDETTGNLGTGLWMCFQNGEFSGATRMRWRRQDEDLLDIRSNQLRFNSRSKRKKTAAPLGPLLLPYTLTMSTRANQKRWLYCTNH